ncbi:MAG: Cas8a1 family CRISPR/Cas system-associated protein, partial [Armatimonadota bacterium]|nr:Cas8a1 family CRISPR/Cas system-associated protein [Armatimonadota bacterium]
IAGMCAAAEVEYPEDLDYDRVCAATKRLVRIFTSPQALEPKAGPENSKASAFATSEMSIFFPNGPLHNPSNKPNDKAVKYKRQIEDFLAQLNQPTTSSMACFACGRPTALAATKMDFPLIDSAERRNFHPAHYSGQPACAQCKLAVQFLPISTMRTSPNGGKFWFISSVDPAVAIAPAAELVLPELERCISTNKRLSLYGDWKVSGREVNAIVSALVALTGRARLLSLIEPKYPARAIFFANDNRNPQTSAIEIPNSIFRYLAKLRLHHDKFEKFIHEALDITQLCDSMLKEQRIIKYCTITSDNANSAGKLKGGWYSHALYMKEVLKMQNYYIKMVEEVALRIAKSEDPLRELKLIKQEKEPMRWLHQAIAKSLMTRNELYTLAPPNDYNAASAALDYIRAAAIDAINCRSENEEWERWDEPISEPDPDRHPIIQLVEEIGERLFISNYDPQKLLNGLRTARNESQIRRVWLRALDANAINWVDFKSLIPPDEQSKVFTIRDYMIAYLCDRLRGSIELEEIEEPEIIFENEENNTIKKEEE